MIASLAVAGFNDFRLIALPAAVSTAAAYLALDLAERARAAHGRSRFAYLLAAFAIMGAGICVSPLSGEEDSHPSSLILYNWPALLRAFATGFAASGLAFWLVSRPRPRLSLTAAGGITLGVGIAATDYVGTIASLQELRSEAPRLLMLSFLLPIAIAIVALYIVFANQERATEPWRKFSAALALGLASAYTFYLISAAILNAPPPDQAGLLYTAQGTTFTLVGTGVTAALILGLVLMISIFDQRLFTQSQQFGESRLQFQGILDSLTEGIVVLDLNLRIVQMNQAASRILGARTDFEMFEQIVDELDIFLPNGEMLSPEHRPSSLALEGKFLDGFEVRLRNKKSGKSVICEVGTAPILDQSGTTTQVVMSYRDITDRRQMDQARAELAAIVESSDDAIIGKDLNGRVTIWNAGADRLFGYTAEEMIGQNISILLPPGRESEEEEILAHVRRGETVKSLETMRRTKRGQTIHVGLSISPIRDAANRVVGASNIARNITERKLLESQLQQSQKMEAIGQLTGGIAHDFNNLLGVVIGNLDLLERQIVGNEFAIRRVQTAQKAAARGADLTRRLLAFSSKEELSPTATALETSVRNMIELAGRALGPEIKIATTFDKTVPPVYVDQPGLESALLNLAVNARDAMPRGGSLSIKTQLIELDQDFPPVQTGELKPGTYAHVSVTDTGSGMSRETLERAFEPFFTTKPRNKGTGLGLAMVYGFARQSGGAVRLYSEEGHGTQVSLYLPLATGMELPPRPSTRVPLPVAQGGKVLVVDDEIDLLEIASTYLTEMGYSVVAAENGALALDAITRLGNIDLMVTDVIMSGGMNGVELAQKVYQLSPQTKVIYSSGFPAQALEERSGTLVDGPLLRKPYQRAEFAAIVQRTMLGTNPRLKIDPSANFNTKDQPRPAK